MSQSQSLPPEPPKLEVKTNQSPPDEVHETSQELLDRLALATKVRAQYWTCGYGASRKTHCGCEDGTDLRRPPCPCDHSPSNIIWCCPHKEHWALPLPCDEQGNVYPNDGNGFYNPQTKERVA